MNTNSQIKGTRWEEHFAPFREQIIGQYAEFVGPYGRKKLIYADWIASGRLYRPIEEKMMRDFGPFVANTHNETSYSGAMMTQAYAEARRIIKAHVNASKEDVFIPTGTGMTGAVLKFQRLLGFKIPEQFADRIKLAEQERPVIFISHMEHHSNQTSWLETIGEVVQITPDKEGLMDLSQLDLLLAKYADRPYKIATVSSCSNVTGIFSPYHEVAKKMHAAGGLCFVDFAASGPYVDIDMHPAEEGAHLDAIFFSPHKFLGGPGTPGILIFNSKLYKNKVPDHPGGGTVKWTNPWGGHRYIDDIETREDGGTPGFLQCMRAALAVKLKEKMGTAAMAAREKELLAYLFPRLDSIPNLVVLADQQRHRLGAISFYLKDCHYNLVVRLLNDLYGIQTRGGCSCAGTYGHYLLEVDPSASKHITDQVDEGDYWARPGWVRLSVHPTLTDAEMIYIADAIEHVAAHWQDYLGDYHRSSGDSNFIPKNESHSEQALLASWYQL